MRKLAASRTPATRSADDANRGRVRRLRTLAAVEGVVLTHHHIGHAGAAQRLRLTSGARVVVHAGDAAAVRGAARSHLPRGLARHCWRPKTARFVAHSLPAGGARYWPVDAPVEVDGENERLDLPGQPRLIHAPGHTPGHAVVVLEERGVVFCGDALVNLDCLSGRRGVQMHRLNEDARQSLDRLATIDADILLFGHGDPWIGPLGRALEHVPSRSSPGPQV